MNPIMIIIGVVEMRGMRIRLIVRIMNKVEEKRQRKRKLGMMPLIKTVFVIIG